MSVEFRMLSPDDAQLFLRVAPDVFDGEPDPVRVAAYLSTPGHHMLVALDEGEIVAQVAAIVHRHIDLPTELYIDNLGVTPRLQRQGIGRELVRRVMDFGRSIGCEEAWVGTEPENERARRLYEKIGAEGEDFVMYVFELQP
jgi:ribosomal protein S18 acetylase RimI-like enzyme